MKTLKIETHVPTIAVYTRVSTKEQADTGDSIDTQKKVCRAHLASVYGPGAYTVVEFSDEGKSGTYGPHILDIEAVGRKTRAGLRQLLRELKAGRIQAVCFMAIDRIYRDDLYWNILQKWSSENEVALHSATEVIPDDDVGTMTSSFLATVAKFQRNSSRKRSQMSIDKRREEGYALGVLTYGYKYEPPDETRENRRTNVQPVPDLLKAVRRIFQLHGEGVTPGAISTQLNNEGFAFEVGVKRGAWNSQRVRNIIKCGTYAGLVRNNGTWVPGLHFEHRIIEPEEWRAHLERISRRAKGLKGLISRDTSRLFARIVKCGCCNHYLGSRFDSPYPYYECKRVNRLPGQTKAHVTISASSLENHVVTEMGRIARDRSILKEAEVRCEAMVQKQRGSVDSDRKAAAARLNRAKERLQNLEDLLADKEINISDFRQAKQRYVAEMDKAAQEYAALQQVLIDGQELRDKVGAVIARLKDFASVWRDLPDRARRELLHDCIETLNVFPLEQEGELELEIGIFSFPSVKVRVLKTRKKLTHVKPAGAEGLTPRQLALLAHLAAGRKLRECAALMGVNLGQVYRLKSQIVAWLDVPIQEAVKLSADHIAGYYSVLPMYTNAPVRGKHQQLRTMEWQIMNLVASGQSCEQIAKKLSVPVDIITSRLESALARTGATDSITGVQEARRLKLSPGKKNWQWGTRRRLEGANRVKDNPKGRV